MNNTTVTFLYTVLVLLIISLSGCAAGGKSDSGCTGLDCKTSKYNLLLADVDFSQASPQATNIQVVATSSYQDMTHPRVSPDKLWVAYTTYYDTNTNGCATTDQGYIDTEIRATRLDGTQTKTIVSKTSGELTSNNYWYNNNYEFTYLNGPPGGTKVYHAQTDNSMNLIAGPTAVYIPATITPYDPMAISDTQLVYGGIWNNGSGNVASIFYQPLGLIPPGTPIGLSLGRDSIGTVLYGSDIQENDAKLSPDGTQVAFMRRAPKSGANGFGWRIFVVAVADPLNEMNISSSLGSSQLNNDVLPEWVDNSTLVFSNIDSTITYNTRTIWTMNSDGTGRKQVILPDGYRYSDVYPFLDASSNQKVIISAEKIDATCSP